MERLLLVLVACTLSACTMMRGAPDEIIDKRYFDNKNSPLALSAAHVEALVYPQTIEIRDAMLIRCLSLVDLRYSDFRHSVVANRKHYAAGVDVLQLAAGIAATLTESVAAKTNYAQLSVLLTGSSAVIDSNYLFGQAMLALVSQMDGDRAAIFSDIYGKLDSGLDVYPGISAFQDCVSYYESGTLLSAIIALNKNAAKEAAAREKDKGDAIRSHVERSRNRQ